MLFMIVQELYSTISPNHFGTRILQKNELLFVCISIKT